jgi:arginyl-tRNA synthetase
MVKAELQRVLEGIVSGLGANVSFDVEYAPAHADADYASNAALAAAKSLKQNPKDVAEAIKEKLLAADLPFIERVDIAGPGFINIALAPAFFAEAVARVQAEGDEWGKNALREGERIMVEHSQPNPFKPFHIGHLMSNTIGESIARLMRFSGATVTTVNYQGDVGLHVAKALWGLMKEGRDASDIAAVGEAYVAGHAAYETNEAFKQEIIDLNKRVYAKDASVWPLYTQGRELSLRHFEELYKILGSTFDHYFFESETAAPGLALVREGRERMVFEESDGAVVFRGEKAGLHTRVFLTKEGLPTYETKDLGLALMKREFRDFDLSITTTAVEQKEYFKVVFEALGVMRPETRGKYMNITHGMMMLDSGKMSSRKGNIVTGESLLMDMIESARQRMHESEVPDKEPVARQIAVASLKYGVLKQSLGRNIIFNKDQWLSLEGDSGPYLQYAQVRAASILRKAKEAGVESDAQASRGEVTLLERLLVRFPEIVERAASDYEPHHVAQYLTELSAAFNSWYAGGKVLDGTDKAPYKLALVDAVRQTLRNGLYLLGIEAPQAM